MIGVVLRQSVQQHIARDARACLAIARIAGGFEQLRIRVRLEHGDEPTMRFEQTAEIAPPAILTDPQLLLLMVAAMQRGRQLTRSEVQAAFPDARWEACRH